MTRYLSSLLFLWCLGATGSLRAADVFWTGGGNDGLWSNTNNWNTQTLPGTNDTVRLGHPDHAPDAHQNIVLDTHTTIDLLWFEGTGDRSVTLSAANGEVLSILAAQPGIQVRSTATADIEFNLGIAVSAVAGGSQRGIQNSSSTSTMILGPDAVMVGNYQLWLRDGKFRVESTIPEAGTLRFTGPATITADRQGGLLGTGQLQMGGGTTLLLESDAAMGGSTYIRGGASGATAFLGVVASEQDVRFNMERITSGEGGANDVYQVIANPDGSDGRLILVVPRWDAGGSAIATIPGSTVELSATMFAADNPGISGGGNLLLKGASAATSYGIRRHMTYTGQTMIDTGIMLFSATAGSEGSLPAATVVAIGENGTLRTQTPQTIAGLTDYQGTSGAVELSAASASLTLDSAQDVSFSGAIHGGGSVRGTLVKRGSGEFTLAGNGRIYDVAAVRVEEGTFGLAGGRVEATEFILTNAAFAVTLSLDDVDATLVTAGTADVTGAALHLALTQGYAPAFGAEFTLLSAAAIAGASVQDGMFSYAHGAEINVDGNPFLIHYIEGNDSIRLTAIPEPGSLLLLLPAAVTLVRRRRVSNRPLSHWGGQ